MRYDIYAWAAPRDITPEEAADRIEQWEAGGGNPADAPFEPSSDVAGFYRELEHDMRGVPEFEVVADAEKHTGRGPVWFGTDPPPPAHIAAIRLPRGDTEALREVLNDVYGVGTKFDLILLDAIHGKLHHPLAEMSDYADATFWPQGAIQAAVAGGGGLVAAIVAYLVGIPIVSGIVIVIGLFMFALSVMSFVSQLRKRKGPST